jgi:hypothetical protein
MNNTTETLATGVRRAPDGALVHGSEGTECHSYFFDAADRLRAPAGPGYEVKTFGVRILRVVVGGRNLDAPTRLDITMSSKQIPRRTWNIVAGGTLPDDLPRWAVDMAAALPGPAHVLNSLVDPATTLVRA